VASDHGGFTLKQQLIPWLQLQGYSVIDLGTNSSESVDYPDFAFAAASAVMQGKADAAIIIDGAGIGSAIAANKTPGVRASLCYDVATARNAREHNHANVLTFGANQIDFEQAKAIVKTWLETPWGGGRHARRVAKITAIEQRFSKAHC
jgi:ribose 5-phosphate isomerase B